MGVSTNIYTVYGVKIDWDEDFYEIYDEKYDELSCSIIIDSMMGEYIIFGEVLFDSGDMRYGLEDGDTCIEVDLSSLAEVREKYIVEFCKHFPSYRHLIDLEWKIISFTHYH